MNEIAVERADVEPIVRNSFPEYRGKRFRVQLHDSVTLSNLNWSGGTRSRYRGVTMSGQPTGSADRFNAMTPWDPEQVEGKSLPIPPGACVVEHTHFCGKDIGITIHVNPADAPRYLPAPGPELSDHERIVLEATAAYKSSYNGKDRYQMALDDAAYAARTTFGRMPPGFPSRPEWEAAKRSLADKGLLNRAGAITNAGRNARTRL